MDFLIHLAIIGAGICWFVWLMAAPKTCICWTLTLGAGFVGSQEGLGGTCVGLSAGGVVAAIIAAIWPTPKKPAEPVDEFPRARPSRDARD